MRLDRGSLGGGRNLQEFRRRRILNERRSVPESLDFANRKVLDGAVKEKFAATALDDLAHCLDVNIEGLLSGKVSLTPIGVLRLGAEFEEVEHDNWLGRRIVAEHLDLTSYGVQRVFDFHLVFPREIRFPRLIVWNAVCQP